MLISCFPDCFECSWWIVFPPNTWVRIEPFFSTNSSAFKRPDHTVKDSWRIFDHKALESAWIGQEMSRFQTSLLGFQSLRRPVLKWQEIFTQKCSWWSRLINFSNKSTHSAKIARVDKPFEWITICPSTWFRASSWLFKDCTDWLAKERNIIAPKTTVEIWFTALWKQMVPKNHLALQFIFFRSEGSVFWSYYGHEQNYMCKFMTKTTTQSMWNHVDF